MAYLGENIPKLGFGLMRLPMLPDGEVDIEQFKAMTDKFLAAGFKYFDTAYGYLGGKSEAAAKVALVDRYPRDSFYLATKLPAWAGPKTAEEAKQMFWTSLERTGAGYFDFYLLHNIGAPRLKFFDDYGIWDFLRERKKEGLIRHLGFSFHDGPELLDELLTKHPDMEFVQLQINYTDWEDASVQSRACYEVVRKHGKSVIIMEPVKGGSLANLPVEVQAPFKAINVEPVSAALRFAASLDGVVTVLSGMSTLGQMEQNLGFMGNFQKLNDAEYQAIDEALKILKSRPSIPCTGCSYCTKGCPVGMPIPDIFTARNKELVYGDKNGALGFYNMAAKVKAKECVGCGQCEAACPQHISIIDELKKISEAYDQ